MSLPQTSYGYRNYNNEIGRTYPFLVKRRKTYYGSRPCSNTSGRRTIIRNQISTGSASHGSAVAAQQPTTYRRRSAKSRIKPATIAIYASVFTLLIVIIAIGYRSPQQVTGVANSAASLAIQPNENDTQTAVNDVVASSIASSVAHSANLSVAPSVASLAISTQIESELPTTDESSSAKPQIIPLSAASRQIETYTVKSGDTVASLSDRFGISENTIKWANDLTGNSLTAGTKLDILPRNGIVYTVKSGDTAESIAEKYQAQAASIITYNDLEISGVTAGLKIIIPNGILPTTERPGYVQPSRAPLSDASVGYNLGYGNAFIGNTWTIRIGTPMYSGNAYAFGNCTAYVYDRRVELGLPVGPFWGNATTWDDSAVRQGLRVSNTPSVGAIIQNEGGYGHVGIVEEILPNGDLRLSEMNAYVSGGGFNIVSGRTLPASQVSNFAYIQ